MSAVMAEDIKRWTARRKAALVVEIIQGTTTGHAPAASFFPEDAADAWRATGAAAT